MTTNIYTEHATIHPVTKEAEKILEERAPVSVLLEREKEKTKNLKVAVKVLGFAWLIMGCSWLLMFAIGFRADRFFYSECVSYPMTPLPVGTPIQK